jgi:hypothetical protein
MVLKSREILIGMKVQRLGRSQFVGEADEVLLKKMFYEIFVKMPKLLFHEKSQIFYQLNNH